MGTSRLAIEETTSLDLVLADMRLYHDDIQLRCFVLSQNGHGTTWGIYRQALMELDSRRSSLAGRRRDQAVAVAELRYARAQVRGWGWTAKSRRTRELAAVDVGKYEDSVTALAVQVTNMLREIRLLLRVAEQCKEELGVINDERRAELNMEFWVAKFVRQARLALLGAGKLDTGLVDALMHLPEGAYESAMEQLSDLGVSQVLSNLRAGAVMVTNEEGLRQIEGKWCPLELAQDRHAS